MTSTPRLMLIDGHALVHRAFHALPEDLATSSGEPTNAVLGFANIVFKAIETVQPTHIVMAMDRPVPTFRHQAFADYKATRPPTPRPLVSQFRRVRELADALNIPIFEVDGFEADDVLGTLALQAETAGAETVVVTGDLDALQLVSDRIHVLTPKRGPVDTELYDMQAVVDRYGIDPEVLPDWKALVGDKSDNIPGVPGVGGKSATKLLATYGNLENLYDHLSDLPEKLRIQLQENRDQAFASRELARIVRTVPIELDFAVCAHGDINRPQLLHVLRELEFWQLISRIQAQTPPETPIASEPAPPSRPQQLAMFGEEPAPAGRQTPLIFVAEPLPRLGSGPATETRTVQTEEELDELMSVLRAAPLIAVDSETTSTDPLQADLVGLSFATRSGQGWYVPVGHREGEQLPKERVLSTLRPLLENPDIGKVGHNMKYDYAVLAEAGITMQGLEFDTMIAAYLINPTGRGLKLSDLALARLDVDMTPIEQLIGRGKLQIAMDQVPIEQVASYAAEDADITFQLRASLAKDLQERGVEDLFRDVEMPLVVVLADMERAGVSLDTTVLSEMSAEMTRVIGGLEGRIYEIAGRRFNIKSTQQLGQLLFQELKLPAGRRTKTGYSTDNEVLEGLRERHEIVDAILEYRQLIKLRDTYVDALPSLINPRTGKVHTDFNQTVASTGRLSSSNPNLQNIPIRGELGRRIRRAFVPGGPDRVLLAADYSQIELRILASMSGDPRLVHAFQTGEDIHRATASAVFGVPLDQVSPDQRRVAKVVNFGIIYGIGEQRLARETGISRGEAADFIANYNETYAGVKAFMDRMRRQAVLYGYVSTLLNRRRYIPDIHSEHPGIRQAAERAAINMPIQGTAADIIKLAMIRLHRELSSRHPKARMILQVHDELVFDVPDAELAAVAPIVRDIMESALPLNVPIEVEMKVGRDWYDMMPLDRVAA